MSDQGATKQPTFNVTIEPLNIDWEKARVNVEAKIQEGLVKFRNEIEQVWQELVRRELDATADEYLKNLHIRVTHEGVEAEINGWLPVALEQGAAPFDMKPGLLRNSSMRIIPMHDGGFRTVSTKSSPESWWHPGFQARAIGEQVKQEAPKIAERIFTSMLSRVEI